MNRCKTCGTEFNGKFCPECGTKAEQYKHCPQCGVEVKPNSKFCIECGYSFTNSHNSDNESNHLNTPKAKKQSTQKIKAIYKALKSAAWLLPTLFTVLLFLFYLTSVAELIGDLDENLKPIMVSIGNVYTLCGNNDIESLSTFSIAIIFIALVVLAYAAVHTIIYLKSKKYPRYIGKLSLTFLLSCGAIIVYLVFMIIGSVLIGQIKNADGDMGYITPSSCPKLLLAFSIIFIVLQVAIVAVEIILIRKYPILLAPTQSEVTTQCLSLDEYIVQANKKYGEYAYKKAQDTAAKQRARYIKKSVELNNLPISEKTDLTEQEKIAILKKIKWHSKLTAVCTFFMFAILLSPATIFGLLFLIKSKWSWNPHKIKSSIYKIVAMLILSLPLCLASNYFWVAIIFQYVMRINTSYSESARWFVNFMSLSPMPFYFVTFVVSIIELIQIRKLTVIFYGTTSLSHCGTIKMEMGNLYEAEKKWVFKKIDERMKVKQATIKAKYGLVENI